MGEIDIRRPPLFPPDSRYWLNRENFDLQEALAYNMSPRDNRQIRKIIYEHFEYIEQQWDEFQRRRRQ